MNANEEIKKIIEELESSLEDDFNRFVEEINKVRSVRVNIDSIRQVRIPEISLKMHQAANIFSSQRELVIEPFDRKNSNLISKAIIGSELGYKLEKLNPEKIYFSLMPLNQEIKNRIIVNYKQKTEEAKVSARRTRQKSLNYLKSSKLSADQEKKAKKEIDDATKKFESRVLKVCEERTKDLVNF